MKNPTLLICFIVSILGTILIASESRKVAKGIARKKWPTTTGIVTNGSVSEGKTYRPVIGYDFSVQQIRYTGETDAQFPGFGMSSSRKEVAYKMLDQFKVGTIVNVFYDPNDPNNSYLKPGPNWAEFTRLSFGAILLGMGLLGIVIVVRKPQDS